MLALIAAILFLIALIFVLAALAFGALTWPVWVTAGLLCLALHSAGVGPRNRWL
jgi:hypothetical protein